MIVNSDKLKLSASSIKTYEQCPRKWKFTYIDKLPKKKWPHTELGSFVHDALEAFHNEMRDHPVPRENWGKVLQEKCKLKLSKYSLTKEQKEKAKEMLDTYLTKLREDGMPEVIYNERGFTIELPGNITLRGFIDRVDKNNDSVHIVDYKGLAIDTPIPTPTGWTTMGQLSVGDFVIGSNGCPTRVTVKSGTHNRPCYKITLSDHSTVVCDNVHLWNIGYRENSSVGNYDTTMDADQLYSLFTDLSNKDTGIIVIQNPKAFQMPEIELPIDPWLLGARLGDDLHIPAIYMRASYNQRLELLRGLMDIDGSWNPQRRRVVFVSAKQDFANSVAELIRTFGVTVQSFKATDKLGNISYRLEFRPVGFNPFKLPRKANKVEESFVERKDKVPHVALRRTIVSMDKVDSVPTQCIAVDAADSLYLCGEGLIVTHNTGKSKYLDEFQLLVYALAILKEFPTLDRVKGSYIVLGEGSKSIPYIISRTDTERCVSEITKVAGMIRSDLTWETRPSRLCSYCDFEAVCPATKAASASEWGNPPGAQDDSV